MERKSQKRNLRALWLPLRGTTLAARAPKTQCFSRYDDYTVNNLTFITVGTPLALSLLGPAHSIHRPFMIGSRSHVKSLIKIWPWTSRVYLKLVDGFWSWQWQLNEVECVSRFFSPVMASTPRLLNLHEEITWHPYLGKRFQLITVNNQSAASAVYMLLWSLGRTPPRPLRDIRCDWGNGFNWLLSKYCVLLS